MAVKTTDNSESAFERQEREEQQQAQRVEFTPRLETIKGRAIMYYSRGADGEGWHCGYLMNVGPTFASVQPIGTMTGELPACIRVDLLDVEPTAILQTKYPTVEAFLAARPAHTVKEIPVEKLDATKPKRTRAAKVKDPALPDSMGKPPAPADLVLPNPPPVPAAPAASKRLPRAEKILTPEFKAAQATAAATGKIKACAAGHDLTTNGTHVDCGHLFAHGELSCYTCFVAKYIKK